MPTATGTPLTPAFLQIVIKGHVLNNDGISSKSIVNVFNYIRTSPWVAETTAHAANGIIATLAAAFNAMLSVAYVGDPSQSRFLDDPTLPAVATNNIGNGTTAADNQPNIVAAFQLLRTDYRGKSYRGSKHYGPIAESDTTNQELSGGGAVKLATLGAAVIAAVAVAGGNTWAPIVLSQTLSNLTSSPASLTYAPITSRLSSNVLGTMRRRKGA